MQQESQPKLKVTIRRLPPSLPEEAFKSSLAQFTYEYYAFYPGKSYKSPAKLDRNSVAFLSFATPETLVSFYNTYNGYRFISKNGVEHAVSVDQVIPKAAKKSDHRENTLDSDPDYLKFVEGLQTDEKGSDDEQVVEISKDSALLVHLKQKKEAARQRSQRDRESRLQQQQQQQQSKPKKKKRNNRSGANKQQTQQSQPQQQNQQTPQQQNQQPPGESQQPLPIPQGRPKHKRNRKPKPAATQPDGDSASRPRVVLMKKDGTEQNFNI